jgi:hypothetical protein
MSQARMQKQQREKARREKASAKVERKVARAEAAAGEPGDAAPVDTNAVLAKVAALHEQFEAGTIEFEEFEETKRELMEQLVQ